MRQLRDYQIEAVEAVRGKWADGVPRPAVVLPTGCGKTDVIARIATDEVAAGGRVLVMAHREELLDQIAERCGMHMPGVPVGRAQGTRTHGLSRPIVVGMVQTLRSEKRQRQLRRPTLVIVDECHHAASPSQMAVLRWAGCFDETSPTRTMGVTATMTRGDSRGLGDVWQTVAFTRDIRWAIDSGWLVPVHGRCVIGDHMDLQHAKVSKGDYKEGELGEMVAQDVAQIVKAWHEHAGDRITVAFTPNIASAQTLADEFRAQGVPVGEVYGSTRTAERQRVYGELAGGRIRVLVSVMVTTEGWDCPPVSCVLMARPTKLPGLYQQIVGRGLRPSPDTGKSDCLVLDVVGASRTQRLVTLVDLAESVEYDTSELDALPCEECGGHLGTPSDEAPEPCICEAEPVVRDPDGGRRRVANAVYGDVDLFGGSRLSWQLTDGGLHFLSAGDRWVVLWPTASGEYFVGHCSSDMRAETDGRMLVESAPMGQAFAAAEEWAIEHDPSVLRRATNLKRWAPEPTEGQLRFATRLGIADAGSYTRADLSVAIDVAQASRRLDGLRRQLGAA